jgi:hypothetical protein
MPKWRKRKYIIIDLSKRPIPSLIVASTIISDGDEERDVRTDKLSSECQEDEGSEE